MDEPFLINGVCRYDYASRSIAAFQAAIEDSLAMARMARRSGKKIGMAPKDMAGTPLLVSPDDLEHEARLVGIELMVRTMSGDMRQDPNQMSKAATGKMTITRALDPTACPWPVM